MSANSIIRSATACLISLCLSGWSVVSSAVAATIVVTTTQDVVDPPFNASGLCGSGGTTADLSGADGQVSLREAIIAANNAPGQKIITFAPSLNGATIIVSKALFLCGGHTTLDGDVNGDDAPDVTLDGTAVSVHDVIAIASSHNLVTNLRVLVPPPSFYIPAGISITNSLGTSIIDNTIAHNIVHGPIAVTAGIDSTNEQSLQDVSIKHAIVRDNTAGGIATVIYGAHNAVDLSIIHNTVSGVTNTGPGLRIGPAIFVVAGLKNLFDPNDLGASNNYLDVTIKENTLTGNSNPGDTAGVAILGGIISSSHNHVTAQLLDNSITNNNGNGISVGAGVDNSSANDVEVKIRGNTLENNAGLGILTYGAFGALLFPSGDSAGNSLDARIERNTVTNALLAGIWVNGGFGSLDGAAEKVVTDNDVDAVVADNTVTGTVGDGLLLTAGGPGVANTNGVEITVKKNTVCGSAAADIHAIGGFLGIPSVLPPNQGTGNEVEGKVTKNTATTIVVENGVAGNTASVTQANNTPCP
jgi:hypothetical protein